MSRSLLFVLAALLASCAGGGPAPEDPGVDPVRAYVQSLLSQLSDAFQERDLERMQRLLSTPRQGSSAKQEQSFTQFANLARALDVERHGLESLRFVYDDMLEDGRQRDFEMDENCHLRIELGTQKGHVAVLRAKSGHGRSLLQLRVEVLDHLVDGTVQRSEHPYTHALAEDIRLDGETLHRIPVRPVPLPGPEVLVRRARFTGKLWLAAFRWDDEELPLNQLRIEPIEILRFPKGFRKVRAAPRKILEVALRAPSTHLGHIFVATWFLSRDAKAADKKAAMHGLIECLRTGPRVCQNTVRSCLLRLAGNDAPRGRDREAWLRWWTQRAR